MTDIPIYQVDAFASQVFAGNPAAVCPLDAWLPDDLMQAIALENNLAETAFLVPRNSSSEGDGAEYDLRWFTPAHEVDLCGHATLGSAYVIANHLNGGATEMRFHSRSGLLTVTRDGDDYTLDFPVLPPKRIDDDPAVADALGAAPKELWDQMDMMAVFASEAEIAALAPDLGKVAALDTRGLIVTAPGDSCDFVSRFFAPRAGIPEDPVTGSAHCISTPYWAERLGKAKMSARQISARGGALEVELRGERVLISGHVAPYMEGRIRV
ncbi:MAG: PhzF family phenazine biosynthesis protein [Alphaproteobacteria bacterium]|nr:PhzF family phenazine biosynthesis protein [Alphaproteobacteria bacterium]